MEAERRPLGALRLVRRAIVVQDRRQPLEPAGAGLETDQIGGVLVALVMPRNRFVELPEQGAIFVAEALFDACVQLTATGREVAVSKIRPACASIWAPTSSKRGNRCHPGFPGGTKWLFESQDVGHRI